VGLDVGSACDGRRGCDLCDRGVGGNGFGVVSCASACVAVGVTYVDDGPRPLSEVWDGVEWSETSNPVRNPDPPHYFEAFFSRRCSWA
jgi:hypothetical protein